MSVWVIELNPIDHTGHFKVGQLSILMEDYVMQIEKKVEKIIERRNKPHQSVRPVSLSHLFQRHPITMNVVL